MRLQTLKLLSDLLLENDGGLEARHDVQQQTTGGCSEARFSARHDVRVQQLEKYTQYEIKAPLLQ